MTTVFNLNSLSSISNPLNKPENISGVTTGSQVALAGSSAATQSTQASAIVSIGNVVPAKLMYQVSVSKVIQVWAPDSAGDAISHLIAQNTTNVGLADRLRGMGGALLDRFKTTASNYQQALVSFNRPQSSQEIGTAKQAAMAELQGMPTNKITLSIKTQSGATVELNIVNSTNGLGVEVSSNKGLSTAERDAISQLSDGFEKAVQGLTQQLPKIDIEGLTKFDASVLASVDLKAAFKSDDQNVLQLSFHTDATQRSLMMETAIGDVNLDIDLSNQALWGNRDQRNKAIGIYLHQFSVAGARGSANSDLVTMFEDAFKQMNALYPGETDKPAPATQNVSAGSRLLKDYQATLMTGLADFQTSMKGVTSSPNPMRLSEIDHFDYSSEQSTLLTTDRNMKLKQTQQSTLSASYHQSLTPDIPLNLGADNASQNYRYFQIEDHASREVSIAYADNKLVSASLAQSSLETTNIKTYQLGILIDEQTSPRQHSMVRDLLETLESFEKKAPYEKSEARQARLLELNNSLLGNSIP